VGVKKPPTMPPTMISGVISASDAAAAATISSMNVERT
jgi:hypothetical protein